MEGLLNKLLGRGWRPRGLERIKGGIIYCGPRGGITFQHKGKVFNFCNAEYVLYKGKEYMDYDSYMKRFYDSVIIDTNHIFGYRKTLRELCSKESQLWQFVCENKLAISYKGRPLKKKHPEWHKFEDSNGEEVPFSSTCDFLTEYRLIETALKDESELEDFLLQSIRVEGK